jgi:DNA (cytosine-5)-methyltransferase 1
MNKPKLLDLFCGAGGAGAGYAEYFDVIGVDIVPQPSYPYRFICADALTFPLEGYDAYHASPNCERFTSMSRNNKAAQLKHPDYIDAIRQRLIATGKPYVIENVGGAKHLLIDPIMLCGHMFGLRVYRHRYFESNVFLMAHSHIRHRAKAAHAGKIPGPGEFWSPEGYFGHKDDAQRAMGIDWMKTTGSRNAEIAKAIPPIYTRYVAEQLIAYIPVEGRAS